LPCSYSQPTLAGVVYSVGGMIMDGISSGASNSSCKGNLQGTKQAEVSALAHTLHPHLHACACLLDATRRLEHPTTRRTRLALARCTVMLTCAQQPPPPSRLVGDPPSGVHLYLGKSLILCTRTTTSVPGSRLSCTWGHSV
jgi:hypothetical protein